MDGEVVGEVTEDVPRETPEVEEVMETPKEVVTEKKSIDSKDDLDDLDEFLDLDDNFNYGDVVWEEVPDDDVLLDDVEEVESLEKEQKHVSNEKTAKDVKKQAANVCREGFY